MFQFFATLGVGWLGAPKTSKTPDPPVRGRARSRSTLSSSALAVIASDESSPRSLAPSQPAVVDKYKVAAEIANSACPVVPRSNTSSFFNPRFAFSSARRFAPPAALEPPLTFAFETSPNHSQRLSPSPSPRASPAPRSSTSATSATRPSRRRLPSSTTRRTRTATRSRRASRFPPASRSTTRCATTPRRPMTPRSSRRARR